MYCSFSICLLWTKLNKRDIKGVVTDQLTKQTIDKKTDTTIYRGKILVLLDLGLGRKITDYKTIEAQVNYMVYIVFRPNKLT